MEPEEESPTAPEEQPPAQQPPLEGAPMEQPPVMPPMAPPPVPPKKKRGKWIALFLVLLVVVVIAVAATNLPQQSPGGDGGEPSWLAVTTLSGIGDKTTDTFAITGSKFRLTWSATADAACVAIFAPDNCPAFFGFFVYPEGETALFVETVSSFDFNFATDETVVFRSGSFYVQVIAANLDSWDIDVHEWR